MVDRKKVIKGLEICSKHGSWHGLDCEHNGAYKDCPYRGCETGCVVTIAKDALALLKSQPDIVRCGECKHYKDGFCYNPNTFDEKTCGNTVPDWYCADGERS